MNLVLSLFPGIGLLDMAFEEEGFCVVRGPDLLWGGDIKRFHPPAGKFDGVIGGPPCQAFSRFRFLNKHAGKHGNLIPEFERCVAESEPDWFVMENVPDAPCPQIDGYEVHSQSLDNRWLGEEQQRVRVISFGTRSGARLQVETVALEAAIYGCAVTADARAVPVAIGGSGKPKPVHGGKGGNAPFNDHHRRSIADMAELQGLPRDFLETEDCPLTSDGKRKVIGNGVPLPMGRAVAKAVRNAMEAT